jgi:hypothetical protein
MEFDDTDSQAPNQTQLLVGIDYQEKQEEEEMENSVPEQSQPDVNLIISNERFNDDDYDNDDSLVSTPEKEEGEEGDGREGGHLLLVLPTSCSLV